MYLKIVYKKYKCAKEYLELSIRSNNSDKGKPYSKTKAVLALMILSSSDNFLKYYTALTFSGRDLTYSVTSSTYSYRYSAEILQEHQWVKTGNGKSLAFLCLKKLYLSLRNKYLFFLLLVFLKSFLTLDTHSFWRGSLLWNICGILSNLCA